jgi:PAS domain S-box-containing protein
MNIREKTDEWLQLKKAHDELGLIEERYRAIFYNAAVGIDLVSAEGRFLQANSTLQDMLGYTEEELKGLSIVDITFPEDRQISQEKLDALTKGTINSYRIEKRYVTKDGSLLWADISISAIRDSDGHHTATIGVISDITERKEAEEALRESEERFRNFLNATDDLAFIKDQHYRYVFVNKANQDFFGLSEQDIIGKTDFKLMPQEVAGGCLETDQRAITENDIIIAEESAAERIFEIRKFPVKLACQEVGVGAFIRDITDRKRAEESLRASEERFRAVIENLQIGISVLNPSMEIVAINKFFQKIYPRVQAGTKQLCFESYNDPPRTSPCPYCPCVKTFQDGRVHESLTETPTGSQVRNYKIISCPIKDAQGHVELVVELVEDVTERKQLEEDKVSVIVELQKALSEVKKLSGFIPICSSCKKIRDDEGYWSEIERYIGEHTDTQFSHGICPDCMRKLYPEYADEVLERQKNKDK